jgi:hypothetical protein
MKVTKQKLNEMVEEAVSAFLKEDVNLNDPNIQIITSLEPKFVMALKQIKDGLKSYYAVMQELTKAPHPRVKEIGERGMETAAHEETRWRTIADDLYVAKWQVEYDEDAERIAQAGDEHDNRGTLGEPKL